MVRIFLSAIGYMSAIVGIPVVAAVCVFALALRYRAWEAIVLGLFMDFLWLPTDLSLYTFPYFTFGALIVVWLFEPLRAQFLR